MGFKTFHERVQSSIRFLKINEYYDNKLGFGTFNFFELIESEEKFSSLAVLATPLAVVQHPIRILLALAARCPVFTVFVRVFALYK